MTRSTAYRLRRHGKRSDSFSKNSGDESAKVNLKNRVLDWTLIRNKTMKAILANWKTTLGGIGLLASGIAAAAHTLADGWQSGDMDLITAAIGGITGGFAMIFARDADKSSETSGAK